MNTARMKRLAAGLLALTVALTLTPCLSLPVRATESSAEALSLLESIPSYRPRDPFGFLPGTASLQNDLPARFDLRHVGSSEDDPGVSYVTPVKLQNPFGTCWGFSSIAAAEASLLSSGVAEDFFAAAADPEKGLWELNLSEKHLAYFLHETDHGFAPDDPHSQNGEGLVYTGDMGTPPAVMTRAGWHSIPPACLPPAPVRCWSTGIPSWNTTAHTGASSTSQVRRMCPIAIVRTTTGA